MDRRAFFGTMIGGVAATAAVRTWPFRVFSFPSEVVTGAKSIRFIRAYDVLEGKMITRFDILYGWQTLDASRGMTIG